MLSIDFEKGAVVMAIVTVLVLFGSSVGFAANPSQYLIPERDELRMAATAAPRSITEDAAYWVLRSAGYERVKAGTNGFHCFVERSWSGL